MTHIPMIMFRAVRVPEHRPSKIFFEDHVCEFTLRTEAGSCEGKTTIKLDEIKKIFSNISRHTILF